MRERANKRWARRVQVQFWEKGERARVGYTVNVSAVGMFVATRRPSAKGTRVTVKVMLPDRSFELEAVVQHALRSSPLLQKIRQSGMGLRFLRRQPKIRDLLADAGTGAVPVESIEDRESAAERPGRGGTAVIPLGPTGAEPTESHSPGTPLEPGVEFDVDLDLDLEMEMTETEAPEADLAAELDLPPELSGPDMKTDGAFRRLLKALGRARETAHLKEEELRQHLLRTDSREEELGEKVQKLERALEESDSARRRISRHLMAMTDGQDSLRSEISRVEMARDVLESSLGEATSELERAGRELDDARSEIARLHADREPPIALAPPPPEELPEPTVPESAERPRRRLLPFAALLLAGLAVGIPLGMRLRAPEANTASPSPPAATPVAEAAPREPEPSPGGTAEPSERGDGEVATPADVLARAPEPVTDPQIAEMEATEMEVAEPAPDPEPDAPAPEEAIRAWADSWSEQRVDDYLACYSERFQPPDGLDRGAWEAQRRDRLLRPRSIRVSLGEVSRTDLGPGSSRVSFQQSYETETYSDRVAKTLELALEGGRWRIVDERVDG